MIFIDRKSGHCRLADARPAAGWIEVTGRSKGRLLYRREERDGWRADYAFEPDARLWVVQGWERVRFVPAAAAVIRGKGARTGLAIEVAPLHPEEKPAAEEHLWLILPRKPGEEAPATRPGAQARYALAEVSAGLEPSRVALDLLAWSILGAQIDLDKAQWVLRGPPVSPEDSRMLRRLRPILELAARLATDSMALASRYRDQAAATPR